MSTALKNDGTLWGWGAANYIMKSGVPYDEAAYSTPVQIANDFISVGDKWGIKADGSLWLWGPSSMITGNYEDEDTINTKPVRVMENVMSVSLAEGADICNVALKKDGTLWVWGAGDQTSLDVDGCIPVSSAVKVLDDVKQAQTGGYFSSWMALKNDGTLWDESGKIMDNVAAFSANWNVYLAIKTDGSLWAWGDHQKTFVAVDNAVKVMNHVVYAQAGYTEYAITEDGILWTWSNDQAIPGGQISPIRITDNAVAIESIVGHVHDWKPAVLKKDGTLWILNESGQPGMTKLLDNVKLPEGGMSTSTTPTTPTNPTTPTKPTQPTTPTNPTTPDNSVNFTDVKNGDWFKPYVEKAAQAGLVNGIGGGKYDPQGNLTVAQAMVLAYQIDSKATGRELPKVSGAWYMPYYQYCLDNGIVNRNSFSQSSLTRTASRYDMVNILDKSVPASRMTAVKTITSIPDVPRSGNDIVYKWYQAGILAGDTQGRFNGSSNITRAEVAVILCQINNLI